MKPVDILVIAAVAALLILAVYLNKRRKRTGSCCGNCSDCAKTRPTCGKKGRG